METYTGHTMLTTGIRATTDFNFQIVVMNQIRIFIREVLQASVLGPLTHCVHGCGLWADGGLQLFYEDVGRHNAVVMPYRIAECAERLARAIGSCEYQPGKLAGAEAEKTLACSANLHRVLRLGDHVG